VITALTLAAALAALPSDARVGPGGVPSLSEAWWRWLYQPRDGMRPHQDPTGARCHAGQSGDVWFLAGSPATGKVTRTCAVPEGKYLFVPVYVVLEYSQPGRRRDCAVLRAQAKAEASRDITWRVELDGQPLAPVRSASAACFDAYADAVDDAPSPGLYAPATSDGWWLLLPPLPAGQHRLVVESTQATEGALRSRYDQQFTYLLDVGGEIGESPLEQAAPGEAKEVITL
jgi:hypothetical protein